MGLIVVPSPYEGQIKIAYKQHLQQQVAHGRLVINSKYDGYCSFCSYCGGYNSYCCYDYDYDGDNHQQYTYFICLLLDPCGYFQEQQKANFLFLLFHSIAGYVNNYRTGVQNQSQKAYVLELSTAICQLRDLRQLSSFFSYKGKPIYIHIKEQYHPQRGKTLKLLCACHSTKKTYNIFLLVV